MDEMRKGGGRDVLSSPEKRDHIQENGKVPKVKKDKIPPQTVTLNKCHLLRDVEI